MKTLARVTALAVVASLIALLGVTVASAHGGGPRTYSVTFTNLTDNQILTPPVYAVHTGRVSLFDIGTKASPAIREVAENGNLTPLADLLAGLRAVKATGIGAGAEGPLLAGDVRQFDIEAHRHIRLLSTAAMVVCTNDGFIGLDGVRLPRFMGATKTYFVFAMDAGTETNTDDIEDFVPPCGGTPGATMSDPALATDGIISPHPGLSGSASGTWGFDNLEPVASFIITRTG